MTPAPRGDGGRETHNPDRWLREILGRIRLRDTASTPLHLDRRPRRPLRACCRPAVPGRSRTRSPHSEGLTRARTRRCGGAAVRRPELGRVFSATSWSVGKRTKKAAPRSSRLLHRRGTPSGPPSGPPSAGGDVGGISTGSRAPSRGVVPAVVVRGRDKPPEQRLAELHESEDRHGQHQWKYPADDRQSC